MNDNNLDNLFTSNQEDSSHLLLYVKAKELLKLINYLISVIQHTDIEFKNEIQKTWVADSLQSLRTNATHISFYIIDAENSALYAQKMEYATLIKKAGKEIIAETKVIELNGFKDVEYLQLIYTTVDEFRVLFANWITTFDIWNFKIDRWGLFNPPGINYLDEELNDFPFFTTSSFSEELDNVDLESNDAEDDLEDDD